MAHGSHLLLNGELLPRAAACLDPDDRGFLQGDGVFETLRLYDGVPFLLEAHLRRLFASLRAVELEVPWSGEQLAAWIDLLVARNDLERRPGRARLTVSRGIAGSPPPGRPTLLLSADPYAEPAPETYARGVAVVSASTLRQAHPWHQVKSTSRQLQTLLRLEAQRAGAFEALQWNDDGWLAEGSFTNVFVVDRAHLLHTPHPEEGCLRGVTRDAVLELAAGLGMEVHEGGVSRTLVLEAREIFLTASLVEIVPVRQLDGRNAGASCPGPVTQELHRAYRNAVRRARERRAAAREEGGQRAGGA